MFDTESTLVKSVSPAHRMREIDEITAEFVGLATQISALQARQVALAGALYERRNPLGCAVSSHLALRAGLSTVEAKRISRLARRLPGLPLLSEAFRAGRLSEEASDLMVKVATPENEQVLLDSAESATGAQLRTIIKTSRRVRDRDETEPHPDSDEQVNYGSEHETMWSLTARLRPEHGAEIEAVLRAAREDLRASDTPGPAVTHPNDETFLHVFRTYLDNKVKANGRLPERFTAVVHIDTDRLNPHETPANDTTKTHGLVAESNSVAARQAMTFGDGSWICDQGCVIVGHPRPADGRCPVPNCQTTQNTRTRGRRPCRARKVASGLKRWAHHIVGPRSCVMRPLRVGRRARDIMRYRPSEATHDRPADSRCS